MSAPGESLIERFLDWRRAPAPAGPATVIAPGFVYAASTPSGSWCDDPKQPVSSLMGIRDRVHVLEETASATHLGLTARLEDEVTGLRTLWQWILSTADDRITRAVGRVLSSEAERVALRPHELADLSDAWLRETEQLAARLHAEAAAHAAELTVRFARYGIRPDSTGEHRRVLAPVFARGWKPKPPRFGPAIVFRGPGWWYFPLGWDNGCADIVDDHQVGAIGHVCSADDLFVELMLKERGVPMAGKDRWRVRIENRGATLPTTLDLRCGLHQAIETGELVTLNDPFALSPLVRLIEDGLLELKVLEVD